MSGSAKTMLGEVVMRNGARRDPVDGEVNGEDATDEEESEKMKARAFGAIPLTWTVGAAVGYVLFLPDSFQSLIHLI